MECQLINTISRRMSFHQFEKFSYSKKTIFHVENWFSLFHFFFLLLREHLSNKYWLVSSMYEYYSAVIQWRWCEQLEKWDRNKKQTKRAKIALRGNFIHFIGFFFSSSSFFLSFSLNWLRRHCHSIAGRNEI